MEDRTLLASMLWANAAGGDWDVASNWVDQSNSNDHHVPTASDDALIDQAGITVTHSSSTSDSVNSVTVASGTTLSLSNGTMSIAAGSTISGDLTMSGGTLSPAAGLTVSGPTDWTGGTITGGGTITTEGTLTMGDPNQYNNECLSGATLDNAGAATLADANTYNGLQLWNDALFHNLAGASFTLLSSDLINVDSSGPIFQNDGTLTQSPGATGTSRVYASFNQTATGSTEVQGGNLQFDGGGTITRSMTVDAGASVEFAGGTFALDGSSTISGAGTVYFTGATVNDAGAYSVAGTTYVFSGTLNFDGSQSVSIPNLTMSGGTLTGFPALTVTAQTDWTGGTITGGGTITTDGTLTMGDPNRYDNEYLYGATLDNAGAATLADANNSYGLQLWNDAVFDNQVGASFTFLTAAPVSGGGTEVFQNEGTLAQSAAVAGTSSISATYKNLGLGSISVQGGSLSINGGVVLGTSGYIASALTATLLLSGGVTGTTGNVSLFRPLGSLTIQGPGSASSPQLLEVMSQDLGNELAGFQGNFHYGTIALANNAYVQLVDQAQNSAGSTGPEALYVDSLVVPAGTTLDLNGLSVYTRESQIDGTVINGTIEQVGSGGPIAFADTVPGTIATAGQVDSWTFFGRAGSGATVFVNPGNASAPAALVPYIENAQVSLIDPNGNVLATANDADPGNLLTLPGVSLPVDGVYTIQVQAEASEASSTGHYLVTVYNAVTTTEPAPFDQVVNGALGSPYDVNNYTFTASANQQINFNLLDVANSTIEFMLTAPDGTTVFQDLKATSGLLNLSQAGTYTLSADDYFGTPGAYSFSIDQTAVAALTLGTTYQGTLSGSDQPQLFTVQLASPQALLVVFNDATTSDQDELYLNLGAPPTRSDYQYRFTPPASASEQVVAPDAAPGTWYILVYGASVPQPSSYTIVATSGDIYLTGSTPDKSATNASTVLTLTGAGFDQTTSVTLIGSSGNAYSPASFTIDTPTQITATFAPGSLVADTYSVEVAKPGIAPAVIPNAITIDLFGQANLVTNLIVPSAVGWHIPTTIYVQYSNTGDVAIPAPLLVVDAYVGSYVYQVNITNSQNQVINQENFSDYSSALNFENNYNYAAYTGGDEPPGTTAQAPVLLDNTVHGAWMTLDPSLANQGYWTSAVPAGFSHTIEILASGKTPGVLEPGESVTVPIYYAGWVLPVPNDSVPKNFTLSTITQGNTTPIDWSSIQAGLQPPGMSNAAWNSLFTNMVAQAGTTWGQFVSTLDQNASYLGRLGENVTDISQLWQFEIQQAMGFNVVPTLASNVDANIAGPGLSLSLSQSYASSILDRDTLGPLGLGWSLDGPWEDTLSTLSDGSVVIQGPGGLYRLFQPDSRNPDHYFDQPGDYGTLIPNSDGTFSVEEVGGELTHFLADGQVDYVQDTNGNRITAGYTGGLLTSLTQSDGQSIQIGYNAPGLIDLVTDPYGRQTTFTYDPTNTYLLSVTNYDGTSQTYTYDGANAGVAANALASVTYTDGVTESFTYDNLGRLSGTSQNAGANPTTISYPGGGEVDLKDATGDLSRLFYDASGLLVKTIDPLGNPTYQTFDSSYNLIQTTGPTGLSSTYSYNAVGQVTSITDALGGTTQFAYNGPFNAETSMTDANGNVTDYAYDANGNLVATTYANGTVAKTSYDAQGNPIGMLNPDGQAIAYTYNTQGQMTAQTFADGTVETNGYDAHGNLVQTVDPTGTTNYVYNANDWLTEVEYPGGLYLKFTYDADGRRTSSVDQTGYTLNYAYDALGNLSTITDGTGAMIVSYTYDADNRLVRKDMGNGTYTTYAYDADGNITSLINYAPDGTINSEFLYTYDSRGLVSSMTTLQGVWTYTYDALGQLTGWNAPDGTFATYSYDAMGNRVLVNENGVTTAYTTNNMNQYTTVGGVTYTYDADGNLIRTQSGSDVTTYSYDPNDRLIAVSSGADSQTYSYDALGNMVASSNDGSVTRNVIDPAGLGSVVGIYDPSGTLITRFDYGTSLICQSAESGMYYYDSDALGSTSGLSNSSGVYVNSYSYQPFGEPLSFTEAVFNPFQFAGQFGVQDTPSGTLFMGNRFYDTSTGKFMTSDPLGVAGGDTNLSRYAGNNPVTLVDPLGLGYFESNSDPYTEALGQILGIPGYQYGAGHVQYHFDNGETAGFGPSGNIVLSPGKVYGNPSSAYHQVGGTYDDNLIRAQIKVWKEVNQDQTQYYQTEFYNCQTWANLIQQMYHEAGGQTSGGGGFQAYLLHDLIPGADFLYPGNGSGGGEPPEQSPDTVPTTSPASFDPNSLVGPSGYGSQGFITANQPFAYRVDFENSPTATAPAQEVDVTDQLDPNLDWSTLQFTAVGFGDTNITIPVGSQYFATTVPMTYNGETFDVEIELGFSVATGQVYAHFYSIDPTTQLPPDVLAGFLPPEDGTGRGQGYFSYIVSPKAGLATGTQIRNVAAITFDLSNTITTDQVSDDDPSQGVDPSKQALNTIDAGAPTSSVSALPATESSAVFTVSWSGQDDPGGSGIATYDVYASDNGGAYTLWQQGTSDTSALFFGAIGHTYSFFSVATDNVGNREATPAAAEASTTVMAATQATSFTTIAGSSIYGGTATITATLTANGIGVANEPVTFTLINGSTITTVGTATTNANGVAILPGVSLGGIGAGTDAGYVGASFAGDTSYSESSGSGELTVAQAPLTVTANPASMAYGGTVPALTYTYNGLVNGDTSATFTGSLATTASSSSGVASP